MQSIAKHIGTVLRSNFIPFLANRLVKKGVLKDGEETVNYMRHLVNEWIDAGEPTDPRDRVSPSPSVDTTEDVTDCAVGNLECKSESVPDDNDIDYGNLKVNELKVLCRRYGLPVTGTKIELVDRCKRAVVERRETPNADRSKRVDPPTGNRDIRTAFEKLSTSSEEKKKRKVVDEGEDEPKQKISVQKKTATKTLDKSDDRVVEQIRAVVRHHSSGDPKRTDSIRLKRCPFGTEYYDPATRLVFNADNEVVGSLETDGTIEPLTKTTLKLCKEMNLEYVVPFDFFDSDDDDE